MKYVSRRADVHATRNPQYLISHEGWDMFWYKTPKSVCIIRTVNGRTSAHETFLKELVKEGQMDKYRRVFFANLGNGVGKAYLLAFEKICDLLQDPSISPNSR